MNEQQIEEAARELCRMRGLDPDGKQPEMYLTKKYHLPEALAGIGLAYAIPASNRDDGLYENWRDVKVIDEAIKEVREEFRRQQVQQAIRKGST